MSKNVDELRTKLQILKKDEQLKECMRIAHEHSFEEDNDVKWSLGMMRGGLAAALHSALGSRTPHDLDIVAASDLIDALENALSRTQNLNEAIDAFIDDVVTDLVRICEFDNGPILEISESETGQIATHTLIFKLTSNELALELVHGATVNDEVPYSLQGRVLASETAANQIVNLIYVMARSIARSGVLLIDGIQIWDHVEHSREWGHWWLVPADLTGCYEDANTTPNNEIDWLIRKMQWGLSSLSASQRGPTGAMERSIARAIRFLMEADKATELAVAIACCFAAIEAIIGKNVDKLTEYIAQRCAALLMKPDDAKRAAAVKFVKKLYDVRCAVLHGREWDVKFSHWVRCRTFAAAMLRAACQWLCDQQAKEPDKVSRDCFHRALNVAYEQKAAVPAVQLNHVAHLWSW